MGTRRVETKGVEEARNSLPALLDAAAQGRTTIITRRGAAVAAIVPAHAAAGRRALSLLSLAGTGRGLWAPKAVARSREEWNR